MNACAASACGALSVAGGCGGEPLLGIGKLAGGEQRFGSSHDHFRIQWALRKLLDKRVVGCPCLGCLAEFFLSHTQGIQSFAAHGVLGLFLQHLCVGRCSFSLFATRIKRFAAVVQRLAERFAGRGKISGFGKRRGQCGQRRRLRLAGAAELPGARPALDSRPGDLVAFGEVAYVYRVRGPASRGGSGGTSSAAPKS